MTDRGARRKRVSHAGPASFSFRALPGHVSPSLAGSNLQIIADAATPRNEPKLDLLVGFDLLGHRFCSRKGG